MKTSAATLLALDVSCAQLDLLERAVVGLHAWFAEAARAMPWRESRDPYAIWISEVMLQQTQVATVVPYYERWLCELPTVAALAAADEARVLKLWEGLGYYSRARNLHRAARVIVDEHGGELPRDPGAFRKLPGVGAYTAAAVGSIAFGAAVATVDGNVRRVLSRLVALDEEPTRAPYARVLDALAERLLAADTTESDQQRAQRTGPALTAPSRHNQAMMELGALVCTPRQPRCDVCPFGGACLGYAAGEPTRFPPRRARRAAPHHDLAVAVVVDNSGALLLEQRPARGLLAGLWDLPRARLDAGPATARARERVLAELLAEHYGVARVRAEAHLAPVDHVFTHLKVTLHPTVMRVLKKAAAVRAADGDAAQPRRWVSTQGLAEHALPTATRHVLASFSAYDEHTREQQQQQEQEQERQQQQQQQQQRRREQRQRRGR